MARSVVDIGNCSADNEEMVGNGGKREHFGLEPLAARRVAAPLLGGGGVIANMECVVEGANSGQQVRHVGPEAGDGTFVVDGDVLDLKDRMVKWQIFQD